MDNELGYDIRNHLYDEAEKRWWWSLGLTLGMQTLLLVSLFWQNRLFTYISGFVALIVPLAVTWLREWALSYTNKADKCRRLVMYAEGLGERVPPEEEAEVRTWTMGKRMGPAPFKPPYFASALEPGPRKLADIVVESAFFTFSIADRVKTRLIFALIGSLGVLLIILFFGVINNAGNPELLGKTVLLIASFVLGSDILLLLKRYMDLHEGAKDAFNRCVQLRSKENPPLFEVMQAVEDYNLILIQSPPVPYTLHMKYNDELNQSYRVSHAITPENR